jgi:hypothetical protein
MTSERIKELREHAAKPYVNGYALVEALDEIERIWGCEVERDYYYAKLAKAKEALTELSEFNAGGRPDYDHIECIKLMATRAKDALREIE